MQLCTRFRGISTAALATLLAASALTAQTNPASAVSPGNNEAMQNVRSETAIRTGIRYRNLRPTKNNMRDHSSQTRETSITPLYIFGNPFTFALDMA